MKDEIIYSLIEYTELYPTIKILYAYDKNTDMHIIELHQDNFNPDCINHNSYIKNKANLRRKILKISESYDKDILLTSNCKHHDMSLLLWKYNF